MLPSPPAGLSQQNPQILFELAKFGDRAKDLENKTPPVLDSKNYTIIRIDGHCFSTFTKKFKKPIDSRIEKAMVETTKALLQEFTASVGYTQSDEITLLIPPRLEQKSKEWRPLIFGGRKQKLESLAAGCASAYFLYHLGVFALPPKTPLPYFDARAISVDNEKDVIDLFRWRHTYDCFRNGVSSLALALCCHGKRKGKELQNLNTTQRIELIKQSTGLDDALEKCPQHLYGTFVKRVQTTELVQTLHDHKRDDQPNVVIRNRLHTFTKVDVGDWPTFLELPSVQKIVGDIVC